MRIYDDRLRAAAEDAAAQGDRREALGLLEVLLTSAQTDRGALDLTLRLLKKNVEEYEAGSQAGASAELGRQLRRFAPQFGEQPGKADPAQLTTLGDLLLAFATRLTSEGDSEDATATATAGLQLLISADPEGHHVPELIARRPDTAWELVASRAALRAGVADRNLVETVQRLILQDQTARSPETQVAQLQELLDLASEWQLDDIVARRALSEALRARATDMAPDDPGQALKLAKRALRVTEDPDADEALMSLIAREALLQGSEDDALSILRSQRKRRPDDPAVAALLASVLKQRISTRLVNGALPPRLRAEALELQRIVTAVSEIDDQEIEALVGQVLGDKA